MIISTDAHPHIADGHEERRIQILSGWGCRVPAEPIPPRAGTLKTQQLGLMQENYTPTPPHLQPFHVPLALHLQWSLFVRSKTAISCN